MPQGVVDGVAPGEQSAHGTGGAHGGDLTGPARRARRPLRVLLVSQEFPPQTDWGGIGTYAGILAPALAAGGAQVTVLSVVRGQERSRELRDGVTVLRAPLRGLRGAGRLTAMPQAARRLALARAVRREVGALDVAPDVVECPEWGAEGLLLAATGVPVVVRLHSSAAQVFPYTLQGGGLFGLDGWAACALEARAARRAALVTSTAANAHDGARALNLDPAGVRRIAHPVVAREPAPWPAGDRAPRVLFAGRLEPRKGPETLMRAVPAVLAAVPGARFAFAGRDAGSADGLRRLAEELGVAHAVELLGHCDRPALAAQYAAATACAVPSRWESFGNVVAEAALLGRPVVASDIAPFRELVGDGQTGRLVPAADARAWAAALVDVLSDPARARAMGRAGAERVRALGDPARIAAETLAAYRDAIATAGAAAAGAARRRT